jgi:methylated-DNA-protein-cysteine methyltransferase-like protein
VTGVTERTRTENFTESVVAVIESIPSGSVVTYGEVAAEAGYPGAARAVGNLLRNTPGLPWWRVIASSGRLVPGNEADHAQRLRAEGVRVVRGKVAMKDTV